MADDAVKLHTPDKGAAWISMRIDAARDTEISVTTNVNKHIYVQIGSRERLTLILHPHAAKRLIAGMEAVMAGSEFVKP